MTVVKEKTTEIATREIKAIGSFIGNKLELEVPDTSQEEAEKLVDDYKDHVVTAENLKESDKIHKKIKGPRLALSEQDTANRKVITDFKELISFKPRVILLKELEDRIWADMKAVKDEKKRTKAEAATKAAEAKLATAQAENEYTKNLEDLKCGLQKKINNSKTAEEADRTMQIINMYIHPQTPQRLKDLEAKFGERLEEAQDALLPLSHSAKTLKENFELKEKLGDKEDEELEMYREMYQMLSPEDDAVDTYDVETLKMLIEMAQEEDESTPVISKEEDESTPVISKEEDLTGGGLGNGATIGCGSEPVDFRDGFMSDEDELIPDDTNGRVESKLTPDTDKHLVHTVYDENLNSVKLNHEQTVIAIDDLMRDAVEKMKLIQCDNIAGVYRNKMVEALGAFVNGESE